MAQPPPGSSAARAGQAAPESVSVLDALRLQAAQCHALGSVVYGDLLDGLIQDYAGGGMIAPLLDGRSARPLHDAITLRLLGALHRFALAGEAPRLAAHFASTGGNYASSPAASAALLRDALATIDERRHDVVAALGRGVQTNEVGRSATLVGGFATIARRTGSRPLHLCEFGSSAGLLLNWDRYHYDTGSSTLGDPASAVRFGPESWDGRAPELTGVQVVDRRGCDLAPIDASSAHGRLTLQSFVWPDQAARFARLTSALDIAAKYPSAVERADAGEWLGRQLGGRGDPGTTTVVYHSIVLQYLPRATLDTVRSTIVAAGRRATQDAPLAWLRLEPAGAVADLRLTLWPGGTEDVLATSGYHGPPVRWR